MRPALVTAEVGIDGVAKAFADLANPEAHTKIIVAAVAVMFAA